MFVGATAVTYLLHSGLSLAQVAALKSVQAIIILIGELPTGIYADTVGRRKSLIAGAAAAAAGAALYYFGRSFPVFILAEICAALSMCFWSGAYEAYSIDAAGLEKSPGEMDRFFHLNQSINSIVVLLLGLLGGILGTFGLNFPYLGAISAFVIIGVLLIGLPPDHHETTTPGLSSIQWGAEIKRHFKAAIHQGLLHPILFPFFAANVAIQLMIQPILHYWQPYFQALSPQVDSARQGVIFAAYCGTSAIFGLMYARQSQSGWAQSRWTTAILFFVFSCLYLLLSRAGSWPLALGLFALLQGVLSVARTSLSVRMNESIESGSRASILSALSLTSRLGMVAALAMIANIVVNKEGAASGEVLSLYRVFGMLSFAICGLVLAAGLMGRKNGRPVQESPS